MVIVFQEISLNEFFKFIAHTKEHISEILGGSNTTFNITENEQNWSRAQKTYMNGIS